MKAFSHITVAVGLALLGSRLLSAGEAEDRRLLEAVAGAVRPALAGLDPAPALEYPEHFSSLVVKFRTRTYKVHGASKTGERSAEPRDQVGPDYRGFILRAHLQEAGTVHQACTPQTIREPYWATDLDVTPVAGTGKQVYWALSYGGRTDKDLLAEVRRRMKSLGGPSSSASPPAFAGDGAATRALLLSPVDDPALSPERRYAELDLNGNGGSEIGNGVYSAVFNETTILETKAVGAAVAAYLRLKEACARCEASHPGEGHGERCGPPYEMGRFVDRLVRDEDALAEVLGSPRIPDKDKKDIRQYLAEATEKAPTPATDFSPAPAAFDSVRFIKSPVIRHRVHGSRTASTNTPAVTTDMAVLRALRWLTLVQNQDGSWGGDEDHASLTGLAVLSFLGRGETPASEEFGDAVRRGFEFLARDGLATDMKDATAIGISTWALCEGHALTRVPMLREEGEKGLSAVLKAQRPSGLWDSRLRAQDGKDDPLASLWPFLAIKAGIMMGSDMAGLREALVAAADGMRNALERESDLTTVAAATWCLQLAGQGNVPLCKAAAGKLLAQVEPDWEAPGCDDPVLRWHLTTRALFHHGGKTWGEWHRRFVPGLVARQSVADELGKRGFWVSPAPDEGKLRATCLSAMTLGTYGIRMLPTFRPMEPEVEEEDEDIEIDIRM